MFGEIFMKQLMMHPTTLEDEIVRVLAQSCKPMSRAEIFQQIDMQVGSDQVTVTIKRMVDTGKITRLGTVATDSTFKPGLYGLPGMEAIAA